MRLEPLTTEERSLLECFALLEPIIGANPPAYNLSVLLERAENLVGVPRWRIEPTLLALQKKGYLKVQSTLNRPHDTPIFRVTLDGWRMLGFAC